MADLATTSPLAFAPDRDAAASLSAPRRRFGAWRPASSLQLKRLALGWLLPLALFVLWSIAARNEWIAPQVLPSPEAVAATFKDLFASGELWGHLQVSLLRVLGGFAAGLVGGLALGVAMGLSPTARDYLYPTFKAFSQVPVLGGLPLLMLLVGIDEALKIILIGKAALVPIALNTCKGIQGVPTRLIEVGRVLGFDRRQMLARDSGWPAAELREEDLLSHVRVAELFRRADSARRG